MPYEPLSAAVTVGASLANEWYAKDAARRNQKYYRENMQANYNISQQAQRNAAKNEVEGLRKAGLSPALADGAAGAPQVSAAGGTQEPAKMDPSNLLLMAQIKNLESQTKKNEAEAANTNQKTGEAQTAGKSASRNLYNFYQTLSEETDDPNLRDFYIAMSKDAQEAGELASGALASSAQFNEFYAASFEAKKRSIEARFDALIAEGRKDKAIKKGDWFDEVVNLPYKQVRKIGAEIAEIGANEENLKVLKKLNEAKEKLTQEEMKRVEAMKKRLEDYNIAQYIKNGDSLGALAAFFGLLIESAATAPAHFNVH